MLCMNSHLCSGYHYLHFTEEIGQVQVAGSPTEVQTLLPSVLLLLSSPATLDEALPGTTLQGFLGVIFTKTLRPHAQKRQPRPRGIK